MGLDISYYRKLTPVEDAAVEDGRPIDRKCVRFGASMQWSEENWPGRGAPLTPDLVYSASEIHGFSAGSYGGHNYWRNWLAKLGGWESARQCWNSAIDEGPFYELVNFADNEGVIRPVVSAKLAANFARRQAAVDAIDDDSEDGWCKQKYAEWRRAFETAADGGAVAFF